jgi:hypothetical protein
MKPDFGWYYQQIADASLELVEQGELYSVFRLRKYPNSSTMSSLLIFGPGVICITGDLRVNKNGVNILGYGLDWFTMNLDAHYLAEKCLDEVYEADRAKADLSAHMKDRLEAAWIYRNRREISHLKALRNLIREEGQWDLFDSAHTLHEALIKLDSDYYEYRFGYGYPTAELGWLSAIQRRFSEEYRRLFPKQETQNG